MAIDALLAKLESDGVTPVTAEEMGAVTAKSAPAMARTAVTPVTAPNNATEPQGVRKPKLGHESERRRRRVVSMLAKNPALLVAVVCEGEGDSVPVAVGIRGKGTCEVQIPACQFDPFTLLDLIKRHGHALH